MASYINNKNLNNKKSNTADNTEWIIKAAADLIKSEIRKMKYDSDYYPTCQDDVDRNWVPKSLMQFLSMFQLSDLRQEKIKQCIVNWTSKSHPFNLAGYRSLTTPNIRIKMVDIWALYDWIYPIIHWSDDIPASRVPNDQQMKSLCPESIFSKFVSDDTDHNIRILNRKGTFYGMGNYQTRGKYWEEFNVKRPTVKPC